MHLPEGSKQSVQIDLRGQNVSDEVLTKLYTEITQKNKWRSKHFLQSEISGVVNYTGLLKKYTRTLDANRTKNLPNRRHNRLR